jgi:quinol monooxygenase YgiN
MADIELTLVTMVFDASDPAPFLDAVARYVVQTRHHDGCRNVDLAASVTATNRYVVIEKWESPEAQRAHFDHPDTVAFAEACKGLLERPPILDLLTGLSAHDLA